MKFNMKFHCEYDEFTSNNKENQIILHTLKKCLILSRRSELKTKTQKLIHQIDRQVEDKIIRMDDFKQIHYTRLNSRYRTPLVLSKLILEHTGFKNIKEMKTDLIVPFFVNMPKLFEKFLEKMFQDYYSEWNVKKQDNRNPWIREPETEDKIGEIEPDLVFYKDSLEDVNGKLIRDNIKLIIDAKYMEEPKRDARFQIAFYLHEYDVKRGFAICPTLEHTLHKDSQNRIMYKDDEAYLLKDEYQNKEIAVRHINVDEFLEIIFFAMVAVFIVLRLRNVLGRRTGSEQPTHPSFTKDKTDARAAGEILPVVGHEIGAGEQHDAAIGHDRELRITQIDTLFTDVGDIAPRVAVVRLQHADCGRAMFVTRRLTAGAEPALAESGQISKRVVRCVIPDLDQGEDLR